MVFAQKDTRPASKKLWPVIAIIVESLFPELTYFALSFFLVILSPVPPSVLAPRPLYVGVN